MKKEWIKMIYVVVELEIRESKAFALFETKAVGIMNNHNGRLVTAFEPDKCFSSSSSTNEVHVLQFNSLADFQDYRKDEELMRLTKLREKAIRKSTVFVQGIEKTYE